MNDPSKEALIEALVAHRVNEEEPLAQLLAADPVLYQYIKDTAYILDTFAQQARDRALEDARRIARKYADVPIGGEAQDTQEAFDLGMVYSTGAVDNAAAIEEAITALKSTANGEPEQQKALETMRPVVEEAARGWDELMRWQNGVDEERRRTGVHGSQHRDAFEAWLDKLTNDAKDALKSTVSGECE